LFFIVGGWIPSWVTGQVMKNMPSIVVETFEKGCEYHLNKN